MGDLIKVKGTAMGPLQGDPALSGGTQTALFEILQNRVPYAYFQKTKIPVDPPGFESGTPCILCRRAVRCATGTKEILAKKFTKFELL